jgi:hypothetical protein
MPRDALVGNAADPEQVRTGRHREKTAQQQYLDDLRELASTPAGERFITRLLADAGVFRLSHGPDSVATAFREGERNAGLKLMNALVQADRTAAARILTASLTALE